MDYYKKLEKKSYARNAISRRHENDPQILDYRGNNVIMVGYRKLRKAFKYYRILADHKFYIGNLAVVTSFDCNLNCYGCGQHTPILKKIPQENKKIDINQIFRDLDKISEAVDGIGDISVANGEGFLNKELKTTIDYFSKNSKILNMNIPTNGSILPSDEILQKMSDNHITATITKYAVITDEKRNEMINLFKKYGIIYTLFEDRKWYMHEYLPETTSSIKDALIKYQSCDKFFMLMQGKLWKCETDATRVFAGIRKEAEGDSICVKNASIKEIRDFLWEKAHLPYIESCLHCRGSKGQYVKEIPAGKQIES